MAKGLAMWPTRNLIFGPISDASRKGGSNLRKFNYKILMNSKKIKLNISYVILSRISVGLKKTHTNLDNIFVFNRKSTAG